MTLAIEIVLWAAIGLVAFAYLGYPLLIFVLARVFGRIPSPPQLHSGQLPRASVLVSALNEEDVIESRVLNNLAQDYPPELLEIVIASDGSIDTTAAKVRELEGRYPGQVRLIDYPVRRGKATVLNETLPRITGEIVVLSDANTYFEPDAVRNLVRWFGDTSVGVVCGKLNLVDVASGTNVDSLYWRYENFLKNCEGKLGALLGSNGAIYAIRRELFIPIPPDTIIDDFMIPLLIKMRHHQRIVFDVQAIAKEETAPNVKAEFKRRVRIGAGGFQSLTRLAALSLPTHGWTSLAFICHKMLRWMCPFFLILALIANLLLIQQPLYRMVLALQVSFYLAAMIGAFLPGNSLPVRLFRLSTMFTSMNIALAFGLWRWLLGQQRGTWQRTAR